MKFEKLLDLYLGDAKTLKLSKEEKKELKNYLTKAALKYEKDYANFEKKYKAEIAKAEKEYKAAALKYEKEAKAAITKFSKEYAKFKKDNNLTDKDVAKALKAYAQEIFHY